MAAKLRRISDSSGASVVTRSGESSDVKVSGKKTTSKDDNKAKHEKKAVSDHRLSSDSQRSNSFTTGLFRVLSAWKESRLPIHGMASRRYRRRQSLDEP